MTFKLAIIPARGGSKGVPRKNIKMLAGKPLIAHNIEAAKAAQHVDRIIVSTDDAEIADVSRTYGADVVMRPADISGDTASSESALLHVLSELSAKEKMQPDILVFLQCTSPLTKAEDIDGTVAALLADKEAQASFSAVRHFHFLWRRDETGAAYGVNHDHTQPRQRRQERAPEYLENGAVYAMRVPAFLNIGRRFCGKAVLYEMPVSRAIEIDDPLDFTLAEMLMQSQA